MELNIKSELIKYLEDKLGYYGESGEMVCNMLKKNYSTLSTKFFVEPNEFNTNFSAYLLNERKTDRKVGVRWFVEYVKDYELSILSLNFLDREEDLESEFSIEGDFIIFNSLLYYIASHKNSIEDLIDNVLWLSSSPRCCIVTTYDLTSLRSKKVNTAELEEIINDSVGVFVEVYDGDSFVFISKMKSRMEEVLK